MTDPTADRSEKPRTPQTESETNQLSTSDTETTSEPTTEAKQADETPTELAARAELLAAENRRLREEYARARQSRYRRTALGLGIVGTIAIAAGLLFPAGREILLVLGATGVFGAILTYYLSPGRFVAADVGEQVYAALAANHAALADELGLQDDRVYLPGDEGDAPHLFVPQRIEYDLPTDRSRPIVTDGRERGLILEPTGGSLLAEFKRATPGEPASPPAPLAAQLADSLVEQFELARSAEPDVDHADGRATIAITGSAFGDVDRFDHPIASLLATGFASGLDRPVHLTVDPAGDRADWLVTCRWEEDEREEPAKERRQQS